MEVRYFIKMKHRVLILLIFLIGNCQLGILHAQSHVLITAGQSNTDGRVNNRLLPGYMKALATDTVGFTTGAYRFCKISQNRGDGQFVPYFPKGRLTDGLWAYDAVTYYLLEEALQEDFYVVKYAVGGTSIQYPNDSAKGRYWSANADWLARTASYEKGGRSLLLSFTDAIDEAIDRTLSKLEGGYTIDAFLWHQGESDDRYEKKYYENLKAVVAYVRRHLTEKTGKDYMRLPFIFGTIPHANRHYKPLVDAAMRRIAEEDPNAYLIDMSEGELQGDRTHFNEKGAEYLGREMYKVLSKILNPDKYGFRVAKYRGDKAAAISYTFDDGLEEHATLVAPMFEKLGFKGTFWINGNTIRQWETNPEAMREAGKPRMDWAQLQQLATAGHEVSNHGWAHQSLPRLHGEALRYEIQHNDTAIFSRTGVFPRTFCYPGNAKSDTSVMVASQGRIATRLLQFSVGGKSTHANLEKRVDDLLAAEDWGVTMTHGITYGYDHFSDAEIFWEHLRKVKAQEDKIWVGTFREVAAYIREQKAITYEVVKTAKGFTVLPELKLDASLFTEPLTAVIELDNNRKLTVRQGRRKLKVQILPGKALFDFDPFGGAIHVEMQKNN